MTTTMTETIRTVQNGAASIAYRVLGPSGETAPTLCLIASTGRGPDDFRHLAEALATGGLRVVLPWPRGMGDSTGPLEGIDFHDLAGDAETIAEGDQVTVTAVISTNQVKVSRLTD